jgi:hypothetical protein
VSPRQNSCALAGKSFRKSSHDDRGEGRGAEYNAWAASARALLRATLAARDGSVVVPFLAVTNIHSKRRLRDLIGAGTLERPPKELAGDAWEYARRIRDKERVSA